MYFQDGKQVSKPLILSNITPWVAASTSLFVLALNTLTLAKQPSVPITDVSVGKWSEPQVLTSVASGFHTTRDRMNLKSETSVQAAVEG